jgi:hypothetical protein
MRSRLILMCAAAVVLVACSSTESGGSLQPASTPSPSTTATTTVVSTTAASTTTVAETTSSAPVTLPAVAPGWTPLDPATVDAYTGFPCCASNWYGTPSPPLPLPGAGLPQNGSYRVVTSWGTDVTAPLRVVLQGFAPCGDLPVGACEDEGGTWAPDSMGVDESTSYPLSLPLDDHIRVVLTGFAGFTDTGATAAFAEGNGADLAELALAVETAHATVIMPKFAGGMTSDQIVAAVSATPEGGFVAGLDENEYSLSFIHGDAPPLLFQTPLRYEDPSASRGTDVLMFPSVQMIDGVLTLYVYAGFYS